MFLEKGVILKKVIRDGNHMVTVTFSVTPDKFVMTAQSDDGSPPQVKEGARQPLLVPVTMPIIVLIDGHSASAAEVIAGALQANGRARVMGEPSYGKGVGQDVVQLPYGRSMHITSFEFFPGGVKMDWVGIVPDIEMKQPADADPIDDPSTDYQLNAANFELIFTAVGNPQPARPRDQVDARRAELEKAHRADFQKEVQMREEVLKRAAEAAASGSTGPN
jgi:C-terminal processing protease CtpA/Prc